MELTKHATYKSTDTGASTKCYYSVATYLTGHHRAGRSGGGSKSAPAPEAGIGGGGIVLADGGRRDGDADDQCSANEGERAGNHGGLRWSGERTYWDILPGED